MKYYNIQTVSQICGLSTHCIRAWEKRYAAIKPERSANGRRVYSENELNRLLMLGKLSSFGHSISLIANLPDEELEKLIGKIGENSPKAHSSSKVQALVDPKIYLNNLFLALNAYKLDILTHELNKASMDLSCKDFAIEVIAALFRKVGEYVQSGRMSIAQEHTLSAIAKFFIGRRIASFYKNDSLGPVKVLLATPKGELHTIGLMLSSLILAEYGVSFVYLGEDLPEESIADAANGIGAKVVLLSVSPAFESFHHNVNQVCMKMRSQLKQDVEIWVGGHISSINGVTLKDGQVQLIKDLQTLEDKITLI